MKIKLKDGTLISVDDNWRELVSKYFAGAKNPNCFYLKVGKRDGYVYVILDKEIRLLHRAVLNYYGKLTVDHIDGNLLNNKTENLRICTQKENVRNRRIPKNNTTGFKGIYITKHNTFASQIKVDGKNIHLGTYKLPQDAAKAYDEAAIKYFGSFARTNKMLGLLEESQ